MSWMCSNSYEPCEKKNILIIQSNQKWLLMEILINIIFTTIRQAEILEMDISKHE